MFFSTAQVLLLLSAGVLHALLYLKMYSWCIRGDRRTPHLTTLPPSSSPIMFLFILFLGSFCCLCFVFLLTEECHINIYSDYEIALSRIKVVRYKFKRHWEEIFRGLFRFIIHASSNPYFCYERLWTSCFVKIIFVELNKYFSLGWLKFSDSVI